MGEKWCPVDTFYFPPRFARAGASFFKKNEKRSTRFWRSGALDRGTNTDQASSCLSPVPSHLIQALFSGTRVEFLIFQWLDCSTGCISRTQSLETDTLGVLSHWDVPIPGKSSAPLVWTPCFIFSRASRALARAFFNFFVKSASRF